MNAHYDLRVRIMRTRSFSIVHSYFSEYPGVLA